ncbi:YLP motif-containing protein 1-like [Forsythia ovata]|uniref:YLP motif-containing protein 1-like n=1 Tax=Forsythia ovata TaxID=205694 RepID=A0ABD1S8B5_9LAMI
MSASRDEMPLTREPCIFSSRNSNTEVGSLAGASGSGISTPGYANTPSSTWQLAFGSRAHPAFYSQANFPQSGIVPFTAKVSGFVRESVEVAQCSDARKRDWFF